MKVEGRNSVREALLSGVTVEKLLVAKDIKDDAGNKIIRAAMDAKVRVLFLDRKVLDSESDTGGHQGFIAFTTEFKYSNVDEMLELAATRGEMPLLVILDGVEDPHNLGSVLRVAECGGAHGVIIPKNRACSVNETVIRVSSGAAEHMKVARVTNINEVIRDLKERGVWVAAAELGGGDIYKTDLNRPLALVTGGEDSGVKRLTRELCDMVVSLPVRGQVNSLNASVACGIALYEALRQRGAGS